MRRLVYGFGLLLALTSVGCGGTATGAESTLQCGCVRESFVTGFLDRTVPDGQSCTNAAIGGCQCLASECQNYCAFDICQPECETNADCTAENFECNDLVGSEFGVLGKFCEFVEPCPEGTTGCPCGPGGECSAFGDQLEALRVKDPIRPASDHSQDEWIFKPEVFLDLSPKLHCFVFCWDERLDS